MEKLGPIVGFNLSSISFSVLFYCFLVNYEQHVPDINCYFSLIKELNLKTFSMSSVYNSIHSFVGVIMQVNVLMMALNIDG